MAQIPNPKISGRPDRDPPAPADTMDAGGKANKKTAASAAANPYQHTQALGSGFLAITHYIDNHGEEVTEYIDNGGAVKAPVGGGIVIDQADFDNAIQHGYTVYRMELGPYDEWLSFSDFETMFYGTADKTQKDGIAAELAAIGHAAVEQAANGA